jgi:hypothetical protein
MSTKRVLSIKQETMRARKSRRWTSLLAACILLSSILTVTVSAHPVSANVPAAPLQQELPPGREGRGSDVATAGTPVTIILLSENFDAATPPNLPAGWAKVQESGTTGDWVTHVGTWNPSGYAAHSAPNLAAFNSYTAPEGDVTRLWYTGPLDMRAVSAPVLTFWMFHDGEYSNSDAVQAQVSIDGGLTWVNVGPTVSRYIHNTYAWQQHVVDLRGFVGQPDVRIGFLATSGYGNDCHIDDVTVSARRVYVFSESFDAVIPPNLPAGWAQVDVSGTAGEWTTHAGTWHPSGYAAHSGPNLAVFNSFTTTVGTATRLWYTGPLDMRGVVAPVLAFWMFHESAYSISNDTVQPQVSIDGGVTWANVGPAIPRYTPGSSAWRQHIVDLQGFVGQPDVRIGFLATTGVFGDDCHIDDVAVVDDIRSIVYVPLVIRN